MATLKGCDIYAGRTKDVAEFRVRVERLHDDPDMEEDNGDRTVVGVTCDRILCLCPAAEKRLAGFVNRGTSLPGKSETKAPSK